jgi:hypothetical protein
MFNLARLCLHTLASLFAQIFEVKLMHGNYRRRENKQLLPLISKKWRMQPPGAIFRSSKKLFCCGFVFFPPPFWQGRPCYKWIGHQKSCLESIWWCIAETLTPYSNSKVPRSATYSNPSVPRSSARAL